MLRRALELSPLMRRLLFLYLVFVGFCFLPFALASGWAHPQDRQPLGSMTCAGEVYVNGAAAPAESQMFAGDVVRTGGTGTATFTLSAQGSFRIFPNSEIVFAGQPQYVAELKLGKVVMNSVGGAAMNLRTGSSVVVAVAESEQSASEIEAPSDGSFFVTCVGGSVAVIPLSGGKGLFMQAGQSASVSAQGQLSVVHPQAATFTAPGSAQTESATRRKHGHMRWVLIGAGVAGAGVAAAVLAGRGSGTPANVQTVAVPSASAAVSSPPSDPNSGSGSTAPSSGSGGNGSSGNGPANGSGNGNSNGNGDGGNQGSSGGQNPPSCHKHKNCKQQVVIGFTFHF